MADRCTTVFVLCLSNEVINVTRPLRHGLLPTRYLLKGQVPFALKLICKDGEDLLQLLPFETQVGHQPCMRSK